MIETVRKIKNVVVANPQVRTAAKEVDEKFRDTVYSGVGTPKNTLRTAMESQPGLPTPAMNMLLDWILPRDERPKSGGDTSQE